MDESNPFDALDDAPGQTAPTAVAAPAAPAAAPPPEANPFDTLDEPDPVHQTAATVNSALKQGDEEMPEVKVTANREKPATWSDVGSAILPTIGSNIETKMAGAQEWAGNRTYNDARKKLWQSMVLPDAVRRAKEQGISLTDDDEVRNIAEHLGIRPDTLTRDWPTYANQTPEQLRDFQAAQRERIAAGGENKDVGAQRRQMAATVAAGVAPNTEGSPLKSIAFDTATMAPDLLVATGGSIATGGIGGVALMAADIAPGEYAQARNMGLDDRKASTYALLSTVASSAPEIPVMKVVSGSPAGRRVLQTAVGEKLADSMAGKIAGTSLTQGVTQSFIQALQEGIDQGLVGTDDSLSDALGKIAHSGIVGAVTGAPLGALHHVTSGGKPTTLRDITAAGEEPPGPEQSGAGAAAPVVPPEQEAAEAPQGANRAGTANPEAPGEDISPPAQPAEQPAEVPRETPGKDEGDDLHGALQALQSKNPSPPQVELLEKAGLATRNDVGVPRLLPAGRRKLAELDAAAAKPAENNPVEAPKEGDATPPAVSRGEGTEPPPHTDEDVPPEPTDETGKYPPPEWASLPDEEAAAAPLVEPEIKAAPPEVPASTPAKPKNTAENTGGVPTSTQSGNRFVDDHDLRAALAAMKNETGWAEVGGRVIRHPETGAVTGRTKWIPNADWWPGRPKGLTETQVHSAVDKALAGEPLSKRETSIVGYMRDVHDERMATEAYLPERGEMPTDYEHRGQMQVPVDDAHETGMVARLADLDPDGFESLAKQHENSEPADFLKAVKARLDEHDRQAARGYRPESTDAVAEEKKAGLRPAGDLFGHDTRTAQQLHDEKLRRDTLRNGGGKDVSADIGVKGDLFSTDANRQTDLEDVPRHESADAAHGMNQGDIVRINAPGNLHHGERARIQSIYRYRPSDDWSFRVQHESGGMQALEAKRLKPLGQVDFLDHLEHARAKTDTTPTDAQKEAGNYAKGTVRFGGMQVAIENPRGSMRKGVSSRGENWERRMLADYGYVKGTHGSDGDAVDVFLTGKPDTGKVYVINQMNQRTRGFDEHKAVLGADSRREATKLYRAHYPPNWKGMGTMIEMSTDAFRHWVNSPRARRQIREADIPAERRSDLARRVKVEQMTPEQLRKEILSHELTQIPNRRAYDESEKLPVQVSVDVDSLKWVNDNMGHQSGDELLKAIASSLSQHTDHAFHLSGDEFAVQAHTEAEAQEVMANVAEHLKHATIEVEMPDGKLIELNGLGVSFGTGKTLKEADEALQGHKARREQEGLRAPRGAAPPGTSVRLGEGGRQDQTRGPSGEKEGVEHGQVKDDAASYSAPAAISDAAGAVGESAKDRRSGGPTLDLFAPENRPNAALARKVAGAAPSPVAKGPQQRTRLVRTGSFTSGIKRVTSWQDAAHILAPLRKSPQESAAALVLDAGNKPLAVIRHSIGDANSAPISRSTLAGAVMRVPGADKVYLAHNHPSGHPEASLPDSQVTHAFNTLLKGSGVELMGHVIMAGGSRKATFLFPQDPEGHKGREGHITAAPRKEALAVPRLERSFTQALPYDRNKEISTQSEATRAIKEVYAQTKAPAGVMLLNTRNIPVRSVPISLDEMAKLRTGDRNTGIGGLLQHVEGSNATTAFIWAPAGEQAKVKYLNLTRALNQMGVSVQEHLVHTDGAHWETLGGGRTAGTHFYSRRQEAAAADVAHDRAAMVSNAVRQAVSSHELAGAHLPPIEVHRDVSTLPEHILGPITRAKGEQLTSAVYDPQTGHVHVIAANNATPEEVRENVLHEVVGHHGLRMAMDPQEYSSTMDGIARDMPERVEAAAQRNGLDLDDPRQRRAAAEEVVAYAAGQQLAGKPVPKTILPYYTRVVRAVRQFVSKVLGRKTYDDTTINQLIVRSLNALKNGRPGTIPGEQAHSQRAPRYYSAVERSVLSSKQEKASADQWLGMLKNAPGVKAEETDWLGLEPWLRSHEGPIAKADVAEYLRAHQVQIEETDHQKITKEQEDKVFETMQSRLGERNRQAEELRAMGHTVRFQPTGEFRSFGYSPPEGEAKIYGAAEGHEDLPADIQQRLKALQDSSEQYAQSYRQWQEGTDEEQVHGPQTGTSYEDYTLPGGEDYTEKLLRLPPRTFRPEDLPKRKAVFERYSARIAALEEQRRNRSMGPNEHQRLTAEVDALRKQRDLEAEAVAPEQPASYQSSHWNEPNVLAHVRYKTRTDPQGRKVLHLEELQSDWHQAGRQRGYQSDISPEQRAKIADLDARIARLRTEGTSEEERREYFQPGRLLPSRYGGADRVVAYRPGPEGYAHRWSVEVAETHRDGTPKEHIRPRIHATDPAQDIIRDLQKERSALDPTRRVPDAPFKTTWPMLIMKRMIRHAAETGHDRLSWTTGQQNADRYGLEKHVKIEYVPKADGRYWVHAIDAHSGSPVFERTVGASELAGILGHEVAQKITTGAGEEKFSDIHDRLVKRGQGTEVFAMRDGKRIARDQEDEGDGNFRIKFADGSDMGVWPSRHSAENEMARMNEAIREPHPRVLEGEDLRVGGEGMKGFYDDILPRETGKLIKKYGAKVGPSVVDATPVTSAERQSYVENGGPSGLAPAHGFDITPQMREHALSQGFPMFARRQQQLALQPPPPKNAVDRLRRAFEAAYESKFSRDIRKYVNPVGMSQDSRAAARVATQYLGRQAHDSVESQEALEHFSRAIEKMPVGDQLEMIDRIETGQPQAIPELQPAADKMREMLDTWRDKVRGLGNGYLDSFIEDYFPHYWAQEDEAQRLVASIQGRRPLRGPATFLKMRTIPTIKEGIGYGLKPLTTNPLILTLLKTREMQRFVTGVTLMKQFKEDGLAKFLPATHQMPDGWAPINDNIAKVRSWSDAEAGWIDRGQYIMPADAARVINNHVSASWYRDFSPVQGFRVLGNMLNAMQLGFSAFHLGFTTLDAIISKTALGVERLAHGEPAKAAAAFAEAATGPGAAALNVKRGYDLLQAYTNPVGATPEMAQLVKALEAGGGRAHMDKYYQLAQGVSPFRGTGLRSLTGDIWDAMHQPTDKLAGVARAAGNFPKEYGTKLLRELQALGKTHSALGIPFEVAGRVVRASTSWIMEHLVPMQKLGVFSDLAQDHIRRNPKEDPHARAEAMQKIWSSVDNRLGEMVYDNLFWNRTFKDTLHLAIRAVGWNAGTIREIGGAPADLVKLIGNAIEKRQISADDLGHKIPYVLAMTATTALYGAVTNYLLTGQGPQELKDYFFPRTGGTTNYGTPQRVSLPSYVKDVYEYSQRPGETVLNKLNPVFNVIGEIWRNQDFFGNPITDPAESNWDAAKHRLAFVASEFTPFSLQGRQQLDKTERPGLGGAIRKVLPSIGVTPAPGYVTSPDEIARGTMYQTEKKYVEDMTYKYKKAIQDKDVGAQQDYLQRLIAAKKHLAEMTKDRGQDKAKAAVARRKNATALRQQGLPATANLVASLPLQPDAEAQEFFTRTAAQAGG